MGIMPLRILIIQWCNSMAKHSGLSAWGELTNATHLCLQLLIKMSFQSDSAFVYNLYSQNYGILEHRGVL